MKPLPESPKDNAPYEQYVERCEERFRNIINRNPDGILIVDQQGLVRFANPAAEILLALPHASLIGHHFGYPLVAKEIAEVDLLRFGHPKPTLTVEMRVVESEWEGEKAFVASLRDITQRKHIQQALENSEQRFRQVLENVHLIALMLDPNGRVIFCNQYLLDLTGYQKQEVIGQEWSEMFLPEDERAEIEQWFPVLEGLSLPMQHENGILTRSGERRTIFWNNTMQTDDAGRVIAITSIGEDVTEHRRATQELYNAERRLEQMLENMMDGVAMIDSDTHLTFLNQAGLRILGLKAEQVLDVALKDKKLFLTEAAPQHVPFHQLSLWQTLLSGKEVEDGHLNFLHPSGEQRWLSINASPLFDAQGQLTGAICSFRDVTDQRLQEDRLRYAATHDALTNLPNRVLLDEKLAQTLQRVRQTPDYRAAVLFLDLDRFKLINDSLGHEAGDQLLTEIGQRLGNILRPGDTVARFGGDEFVLLIEPIQNVASALQVAERIQHQIGQPVQLQAYQIATTASIGIALVDENYTCAEDLLRDADTAMYQAKANGRATCEVFSSEMHQRSINLLQLESDLRQAMKNWEFEVFYQPILSLDTREITAIEALVRWRHPQRGIIHPQAFIQLLEETELVIPIGNWVLQQACQQMATWHATGHSHLRLTVNLSQRQLKDLGLVSKIKTILHQSGLEPTSLELEIQEQTILENQDPVKQNLRALQALGMSLSIDNFGNPQTALGYLKRFPIQRLKIDPSFIKSIGINQEDATSTGAAIELAHVFDIDVVAEGVETNEQLDLLVKQKCDEVQGFLFTPALSAEKLTQWLASGSQQLQNMSPPEVQDSGV